MEHLLKQTEEEIDKKEKSKVFASYGLLYHSPRIRILLVAIFAAIFAVAVFLFYLSPPSDFPTGKMITIKKGVSLSQVSLLFENERLIRSRTVFEFCAIAVGGDKKVIAGEYVFKEPIGACTIATRVVSGASGISAAKITFPEGISNKDIADIASKTLPKFDAKIFSEESFPLQGYLFPETYFFSLEATAKDVETAMSAEFQKKVEPLQADILASKRSLQDIIIMASILEREARLPDDQALVSGILWKRINIDMPLQVDATFYYLLGKTSSELTTADLAMKSAYNTYKNKGLPAGPIGNPGLGAIRAAIYPKESSYLYYLSDKRGAMHYSKNFDEHKANKEKYLR